MLLMAICTAVGQNRLKKWVPKSDINQGLIYSTRTMRNSLCSIYSFRGKKMFSLEIYGASVQEVNLQCVVAQETLKLLDLDCKKKMFNPIY